MSAPSDRSPPKILATRTVAETRIFRVEAMDLEFSNGVQMTYERLAGGGTGAVVIIAMPDPRHFYLIREYAAGSERYELGFPKGRLEAGEDPCEGANREIMEELGYGARELKILKSVASSPGYVQSISHLVLATELYPEQRPGDEPEPVETSLWCIDDINTLLEHHEFADVRSITALLLLERTLK